MGNLLQRLAGKIVMSVLGLVLWIGYVTMCDGGGGSYTEVAELPHVVFGGGGGTIAIEVDLNQPGELSSSFGRWDAEDEYEELTSVQPVAPGQHRFSVDVADSTYGNLEVGVPDAEVGARIEWTVSLDGEELDSEEIELEEPLRSGTAFFVQFAFDEVAELRHYAQR